MKHPREDIHEHGENEPKNTAGMIFSSSVCGG